MLEIECSVSLIHGYTPICDACQSASDAVDGRMPLEEILEQREVNVRLGYIVERDKRERQLELRLPPAATYRTAVTGV